MTNPDLTKIILVVDRSGSMSGHVPATIKGFNAFLDEQKSLPGKADLTLVYFNTEVVRKLTALPLSEVPHLDEANYRPVGGTALYDAVGQTIDAVGADLANLPEEQRPGLVILAVLTDGEENSSKEYTYEQVKARIDHQRDAYNWEVMFLAAGLEAVDAGIGLAGASATMAYAATSEGIAASYADLTRAVTSRRSGTDAATKGSATQD